VQGKPRQLNPSMNIIPEQTRETDSLSARLAGWRETFVATVSRDQLSAALGARLPAAPLLVQAELIVSGLTAEFMLDPITARSNIYPYVLAAVVVAAHRRRPAVASEQVKRIRHFLRQPAVRQRMAWHSEPLIRREIESFNPDGTVTYRWLA